MTVTVEVPNIIRAFRAAFESDRQEIDIPDWMVEWPALGNLKLDLERQATLSYSGPADLRDYFSQIRTYRMLRFFDRAAPSPFAGFEAEYRSLVDHWSAFNRRVLSNYGFTDDDLEGDIATYAHYSAEDYIFANVAPVPARREVRRVLDFGAGFGRQLGTWSRHPNLESYVAVDGIPLSYCVQYDFFRASGMPFNEYLQMPGNAAVPVRPTKEATIWHIPVWREDLLPSNYFDIAIAVMVLPELDPRMIRHTLETFGRVIKPGGALYIRDWDNSVTHNRMAVNELIGTYGFVLEYRPHIAGGTDIYGIPRIWRKREEIATISMR